jgi:hypothetical protein
MEFMVPSLRIVAITNLLDSGAIQEHLSQLIQIDEDILITVFHQQVQKVRDKAWHDRHIKLKKIQIGNLVLLYDRKFMQHPGKLCMHWLGPYVIKEVTEEGVVQLEILKEEALKGRVNENHLKLYQEG